MALKKKPVTGMKDMMPDEMEIRDYVIHLIKETYKTYGFTSMETPCVEHIENLCSKQGGDNEKLIFKILKRGEKLKIEELQRMRADLVDGGLRYDLTVPLCTILCKSMLTSCRHRSRHCRSAMYGEQTVRREDVFVSSCSVILTFSVRHRHLGRDRADPGNDSNAW